MGKAEGHGLKRNTKRKLPNGSTFVVGGLHPDDYEWASKQFEDSDYILVGFELDCDGYHWKALYAKAEYLERISTGGLDRWY